MEHATPSRLQPIQPHHNTTVVPFTQANEYVFAYKQAKRRDDDIAIVTCAWRVILDRTLPTSNEWTVRELSGGFGGMGPTTLATPVTSAACAGKPWSRELVALVADTLLQDLPLSASAPGGMVEYRRALPPSFFFKFYLHVAQALGGGNDVIDPRDRSAIAPKSRPVTMGQQVYVDDRYAQ